MLLTYDFCRMAFVVLTALRVAHILVKLSQGISLL